MGGDVDGAQQELALDVLVNVVQPRHVGGAVADDQLGATAVKVLDDALGGLQRGDVALQAFHSRQGCHGLEVDRHNLHLFFVAISVIITIASMNQPIGQHLRPRPRSGAQVDRPPDAAGAVGRLLGAEDVELLVELEELEGRTGPVARLLGPAVEHVALVAGEASHLGAFWKK